MKNSLLFAALACTSFTSCESTPEPSETETDVVMDSDEDSIVTVLFLLAVIEYGGKMLNQTSLSKLEVSKEHLSTCRRVISKPIISFSWRHCER